MNIKLILMTTFYMLSFFGYAQTSEKPFKWENAMDNIVMTWNKSTPEQEMKDDIKALAEHGVTVKYANVKRNDKNEITAIDVSFEATTGEKGSLSYNNKKPIATIKIYKNGDEVGFGEPSNSFDKIEFASDFKDGDKLMESFKFDSPFGKNHYGMTKKIVIKQNDKEPVVIENGKVVEGGNDYTKEELDELIEKHKETDFNSGEHGLIYSFGENNGESFNNQIEKLIEKYRLEDETSLEESLQELEKVKKELEETKKELEKTKKSSLKVKKA